MSAPKKCQGKESFQRINYLYQVSNNLIATNKHNSYLSRACSNLMVQVSKKSVQRLDVDIKRRICKACKTIILPGVTCRVRVKNKKVKWNCLTCGKSKIFETLKSDKTWSQKDESVVEMIDYATNIN